MHIQTEEVANEGKILFVAKQPNALYHALKKTLSGYGYDIFATSFFTPSSISFDYIFIFDQKDIVHTLLKTVTLPSKVVLIALFSEKKDAVSLLSKKYEGKIPLKVVVVGQESSTELITKVLWFSFSTSREVFLDLTSPLEKKKITKKKPFTPHIDARKSIAYILIILMTAHFFFLIPLIGGAVFTSVGFREIKTYNFAKAKKYIQTASFFFEGTQKTYRFARPAFSIFYLALFLDNVVSIEEYAIKTMEGTIELSENAQKAIALLIKMDKSPAQIDETAARFAKLRIQVESIKSHLTKLSTALRYKIQMLDGVKQQINTAQKHIILGEKLLAHADSLFGKEKEKRYLLFFYNNMELRPGGGFIGSFGSITFDRYTLKNFSVQDVYAADGQLTIHIEPPPAIKRYLQQPNWFLRDSNFSPDFPQNVETAELFLEKELGLVPSDGAIGITTTAVSLLLRAFGEVYLPDYRESVNSDNFYIKTQTHVEKEFFPGSQEKRNFLSSLTRMLLIKLEDAPYQRLMPLVSQALGEKNIVLFFKDQKLQEDIEQLGWTGKFTNLSCSTHRNQTDEEGNCLVDFVFPVDANLGVNKANFFVHRLFDIATTIKKDGTVEHTTTVSFRNESPTDAFPGGVYKNYFQLFIPAKTSVQQVRKNDTLVEEYVDEVDENVRSVGVYSEILPGKTGTIAITYTMEDKILTGKNTYQLIVQKQIGSLYNDLTVSFDFPRTASLIYKNFPGLAKNNKIVYTNTLSTDKIIVIELVQEKQTPD